MRWPFVAVPFVLACGRHPAQSPPQGDPSPAPPGGEMQEGTREERSAPTPRDAGADCGAGPRAVAVAAPASLDWGENAARARPSQPGHPQPRWHSDDEANLVGCTFGVPTCGDEPFTCTCVEPDGGVASNCPLSGPHPGVLGCVWTGVATPLHKGSTRVDSATVCTCAGDGDHAGWNCRRHTSGKNNCVAD
jgi:hypothetical protein